MDQKVKDRLEKLKDIVATAKTSRGEMVEKQQRNLGKLDKYGVEDLESAEKLLTKMDVDCAALTEKVETGEAELEQLYEW